MLHRDLGFTAECGLRGRTELQATGGSTGSWLYANATFAVIQKRLKRTNDYLDRGFETAVEPRVREKTGRDYEGMLRRHVWLQMHQPALQRSDDRLRTIVHIQAAEDSADMALHGCFGNAERLCDVLVAFADDQQTQHLKFARA